MKRLFTNRTFLALLFIVTLSGIAVYAQQPAADPWGFDDEVKVETWGSILRPQAVDLALTTALIGFALVSFFKKSVRLKYITLAATVAYLGVTKSTLISITDIFRVVDWDFPTFKYSLAWYLFAGFTVVSTVLWGRLYCGRICAFGALTQLMDATVPSASAWSRRRGSNAAPLREYGMLVAVVAYFIATTHTGIYRYIEPFWMFRARRTLRALVGLGVLLVATVFVRNLYCRFLCPVGAMLGLLSKLTTVFRIKRWSECKTCKICEKTCEWGAIRGRRSSSPNACAATTANGSTTDQKKCPHWLIIVKKKAGSSKSTDLKFVVRQCVGARCVVRCRVLKCQVHVNAAPLHAPHPRTLAPHLRTDVRSCLRRIRRPMQYRDRVLRPRSALRSCP